MTFPARTATRPRIGILIGSTREGRFSDRPAQWLHALGRQRTDLDTTLVDLRDHPLPFYNEPAVPAQGVAARDATARRWADLLQGLDGLVVVTPEYNHAPPAVLKNALDYAGHGLARKPIGFVGHGEVGAARAVEQLRLTAIALQMVPVRAAVHIGGTERVELAGQRRAFDDFAHLAASAQVLLAHMAWWSRMLGARRFAAENQDPAARA